MSAPKNRTRVKGAKVAKVVPFTMDPDAFACLADAKRLRVPLFQVPLIAEKQDTLTRARAAVAQGLASSTAVVDRLEAKIAKRKASEADKVVNIVDQMGPVAAFFATVRRLEAEVQQLQRACSDAKSADATAR